MTRHSTDMLVTGDQLIDFAWSAPMRDLAALISVSYVGLKKRRECARDGFREARPWYNPWKVEREDRGYEQEITIRARL